MNSKKTKHHLVRIYPDRYPALQAIDSIERLGYNHFYLRMLPNKKYQVIAEVLPEIYIDGERLLVSRRVDRMTQSKLTINLHFGICPGEKDLATYIKKGYAAWQANILFLLKRGLLTNNNGIIELPNHALNILNSLKAIKNALL